MRTISSLLSITILTGFVVLACDPKPTEPAAPPAPSGSVAPIKACQMDAKLCPDGTALGRQGPNCEFPPCPGEKK